MSTLQELSIQIFMIRHRTSNSNFGGLSISSLGSTNGINDGYDEEFDHTEELYQRLHDLEQITNTFLNER